MANVKVCYQGQFFNLFYVVFLIILIARGSLVNYFNALNSLTF